MSSEWIAISTTEGFSFHQTIIPIHVRTTMEEYITFIKDFIIFDKLIFYPDKLIYRLPRYISEFYFDLG